MKSRHAQFVIGSFLIEKNGVIVVYGHQWFIVQEGVVQAEKINSFFTKSHIVSML